VLILLLGGKQSETKQIAVITRSQQFSKLLTSILAEWKFFAAEDPSAATVAFVERGLEFPDPDVRVVWLTSMPLEKGDFLTTPISLSELYLLLEAHFFSTPRKNIRVSVEMSVELKIESEWFQGQLVSLSDRGGRLACAKEIPRGTELTLEVKLEGEILRIPSAVLYCIPAGDSSSRLEAQIGVLFKPTNVEMFERLKRFIEKNCIECACAREGISLNDPCLSWLALPVVNGHP
jgi:hypothetical protein